MDKETERQTLSFLLRNELNCFHSHVSYVRIFFATMYNKAINV